MNLKQFIKENSKDIDNFNFEKIYQDIPLQYNKKFHPPSLQIRNRSFALYE